MRRLSLIIASVALIVGITLYASRGGDSDAPRTPEVTNPQPTTSSQGAAADPSSTGSGAADRPGATATTSSPRSGSTSVGSASAGPASVGSAPSERSPDERTSVHTVERPGERALRRRPEPSPEEDDTARGKRQRRTIEAAACRAPDLEERFAQLPAADAEALRLRCAKYGVTLGAKR